MNRRGVKCVGVVRSNHFVCLVDFLYFLVLFGVVCVSVYVIGIHPWLSQTT
jgi:hypothetical protein